MGKRYYSIAIRPAWLLPPADGFSPDNLLDFDQLELPAPSATFTDEGIPVDVGDGTQYWDGRKISIEVGTMRVDSTEYAYLRDVFHGKATDVLLYDPEQPDMMILAFGMKLSLAKLVESGQTIICKLSGSREMGIDANPNLVQYGGSSDLATVYGTVIDKDSGMPIPGAEIWLICNSDIAFESKTDKDGNFVFVAPYINYGFWSLYAAKAGFKFEDIYEIIVVAGQSLRYDVISNSLEG
jgi:hypothetical protein